MSRREWIRVAVFAGVALLMFADPVRGMGLLALLFLAVALASLFDCVRGRSCIGFLLVLCGVGVFTGGDE